MSNFDFMEEPRKSDAKIKIIGVGGGGCNAVKTMYEADIDGVDFLVANTDVQSLRRTGIPNQFQIGQNLTKGLGAGFEPKVGREAAMSDKAEIADWIGNADMIFITAGMGGGTGTGASPVIAEIAKERGILTVAVVTRPFKFEGKKKADIAQKGIADLKEHVDSMIVIQNEKLRECSDENLSFLDSFKMADKVLLNAVRGISDSINGSGMMNIDFNDVKRVMSSKGMALMGIGHGSGKTRAIDAVEQAISSPLFDSSVNGASGILINFTVPMTVSLHEVTEAVEMVQKEAHEDVLLKMGVVLNEDMGEDELDVTVIATGFETFEESGGQSASVNGAAEQEESGEQARKQATMKVVNGTPLEINRGPFIGRERPNAIGSVKGDPFASYDTPPYLRAIRNNKQGDESKFDYPSYLRPQNS